MRKRPTSSAKNLTVRQRSKTMRIVDRIGRVLLSVVIVLAAIYCLQIVQEIRTADQRRNQAADTHPAQVVAEDAIASMLIGSWQFAGIPWQVSANEMSREEALQQLSAATPPAEGGISVLHSTVKQSQSAAEDNASPTQHKPAEDVVFSFLQMMRPEVSWSVDHVVYHVRRAGVEGIALARHATPERIELVRVALQTDGPRWQFIELDRKANENDSSAAGGGSLLPVPQGFRMLASRCDSRGRVVAELVALESMSNDEGKAADGGHDPLDLLLANWIQAGWSVTSQLRSQGLQIDDRKTRPDRGNSLELAPNVAEDVLVCTRGEESRMVIVSNLADDSKHRTLWIMRTPD